MRKLRTAGMLLLSFVLLLVWGIGAGAARDIELRLEELEKRMEDAAGKGMSIPSDMLEELEALLKEIQEGAEDDGEQEEPGRVSEAPFTGTIVISRNLNGSALIPRDPVNSGESGGTASWSGSSTGRLTAFITGSAEIRDSEGKVIGYQPLGYVTGQVAERESMSARGVSALSTYSASDREDHSFAPGGRVDGWCSLALDPEKERYRLTFPALSLGNGKGKTVITIAAAGTRQEVREPWGGVSPEISWNGPGDQAEEKMRFRPGSSSLSGFAVYTMPPGGLDTDALRKGYGFFPPELSSLKGEILAEFGALADTLASFAGKTPGLYGGTWRVSWNLQIGEVPVEAELETAGDYEHWMPDVAAGMGSTLRVKAKIVKPEGLEGKFVFSLEDVSTEPGECLNSPADDPKDDPDLFFSALSGEGTAILDEGQRAETKDDANEAEVVVSARDFGACGRISALVTVMVGGKETEVRAVFKKTGEPWVTLPRDENGNSVADAWEESHGIYPSAGDGDDECEPSGKAAGDGLSVYEEYRGLMVKGAHRRLDPKKKDLCIHDPYGLAERADFGGVTGLSVHYLTEEEGHCSGGGRDRVVNFNDGRHHLIDQHCLWIKKDSLPAPDRFNWGACEGGDEIGPPRTADRYVNVFVDQIRADITRVFHANSPEITNTLGQRGIKADALWLESQVAGAVSMVTLHEGCHGLGIIHHYKSLRMTLPKTEDIEEAIMKGDINPSMGQLNCVMRYIWDGGKHPRLSFRGEDELLDLLLGRPWPHTLCSTQDDCRGQMLVSDREKGQVF